MNTEQKIAMNFNQNFAAACLKAGVARWVLERLADDSLSTPALRARHDAPEGTRDFELFFPTFAARFPTIAGLAS